MNAICDIVSLLDSVVRCVGEVRKAKFLKQNAKRTKAGSVHMQKSVGGRTWLDMGRRLIRTFQWVVKWCRHQRGWLKRTSILDLKSGDCQCFVR
jgi:hypothetical protein